MIFPTSNARSARTDGADSAIGRRGIPLALGILGFVAGTFPIFETDLFWHLATGRWMFIHRALPRVDPFRFTFHGDWVNHEWLFQLAAHGIERLGGLDALILVRASALATFALLVYYAARRAELRVPLAGLVALATTMGVRPRFLIRPELATLLATLALLLLLEEWLESNVPTARRRVVLTLLGLQVLWVNLHGEAMIAPGLALLFLAGARLRRPLGTSSGERGRSEWLGIPALLGAMLLVNPYSWRIIEVPLGIERALDDLPAVNPEWASALAAPQPFLFAGLGATLALALIARVRCGSWPAPGWASATLATGGLALTGVRHAALFFAVAGPFAAHALASIERTLPRPQRRFRQLDAAVVLLLIAGVAVWAVAPPQEGPLRPRYGGLAWGGGIAAGRFPEGVVRKLGERPEIGPLYNEFAHGGYLLWRLYPAREAFIDGRMELDPTLLARISRARRGPDTWSAFLASQGVVGALVRYDERRRPVLAPAAGGSVRVAEYRTPNAVLFPVALWDLVDWDDDQMLYLRRGSPGWRGEPYRFVQPEDVAWTLERAASDPAFRASSREELKRKLAEDPGCRRAAALLVELNRIPYFVRRASLTLSQPGARSAGL